MKEIPRYILFAIFAISIVLTIYSLNYRDAENPENKACILLLELRQLAESHIDYVIISPYQFSGENFKLLIDSVGCIDEFKKALRKADLTPISGHSGSIFECTITIKTGDKEFQYLASVHEKEINELYVTDKFYEYRGNGLYGKGSDQPARLPGIGKWIMSAAPQGMR
ncbi:MAG: hypothetical protein AB1724_14700 [Thermodesulfobacteriota bacterium]